MPWKLGLGHQSIFAQEEYTMVHFCFCLKDVHENFEKLRLNFSKCNSSPSLPSATTKSSKQASVNKRRHYFWVSIDMKAYFSILKCSKMAWQNSLEVFCSGAALSSGPESLFQFIKGMIKINLISMHTRKEISLSWKDFAILNASTVSYEVVLAFALYLSHASELCPGEVIGFKILWNCKQQLQNWPRWRHLY